MIINAAGTQVVTVGTEHTLFTASAPGVYVLLVDTTAMVNGDVIELSIKAKYASTGAYVQTHYATFAHVQSDPGKVSVPVIVPYAATFNIKQTAGSARSFDWCITSG